MARPDFDWNNDFDEPREPFKLNYRFMVKAAVMDMNSSGPAYHDRYLEHIALRRGSRLLTAIKQYKIENNNWPESLDDIKSNVPAEAFIDPGNEKEFEYALSRLDFHSNGKTTSEKSRIVLFLKGKINYLRGRYDLAINQLFKLVKEKYDYPDGFLYLGKAYEALGLSDKAKWAYERVK